MAEFAFNCPTCSQKIRCTEEWSGHEIQCPACQQNIQVPAAPAPAEPAVETKPGGLKIGLAAHQKTAPPPVATFSHGTNPVRHFSTSQAGSGSSKSEKIKRISMIAAGIAAIAAAGYFGYPALRDYQAKLNVGRQKAGEDSGGGSVGHIAELYDVLDATDPGKHSTVSGYDPGPAASGSAPQGTNAQSGAAEEQPVPPKWTLDLAKIKLQRGKVNGSISGTNFVAGGVFVDVNGATHLLSMREGTNYFSDREVLVYLKLKPGESLKGQTWSIGSDTRTNVPTVVKKWRPNPRYAPQQKSFANGYAMKLEFVNQSADLAQGRIYLALPDAERTVLAGQFSATIRQVRPVASATTPVRPQPQPQRRY